MGDLSHIEVDVERVDVTGQRLRVQSFLLVRLSTAWVNWEGVTAEQTVMQFYRTHTIKAYPLSLRPHRAQGKQPHEVILEQLAQHELDIAIDERNNSLREALQKMRIIFENLEETLSELMSRSTSTPILGQTLRLGCSPSG